MHFFNPAPLMKLVELIAGDAVSRRRSLARRASSARRWASASIDAPTSPASSSTARNRPVRARGAALPQEQVADVETIDRIFRAAPASAWGRSSCRTSSGSTSATRSPVFHELSFGEPRWRPSPLSARMVAAGGYGRKTGRGWYSYARGRSPSTALTSPAAATARRHRRRRSPWPTTCASSPRTRAGRSPTPTSRRRGALPDPRLRPPRRARAARGAADPAADASLPARPGRRRTASTQPRRRRGRGHARPHTDARACEHFVARWAAARRAGDVPGLVSAGSCQVINEAPSRSARASARAGGRRRRHGARHQPPARAARLGGPLGLDHVCSSSTRCARSSARSATAAPPFLRRLAAGYRSPRVSRPARRVVFASLIPPFQRVPRRSTATTCGAFSWPSVGPSDADDCFQETFIAAMRAYPQLAPDSNQRAWVLTIAHRKALDHFRARKRRPLPVEELPEVAVPRRRPADDEAPGRGPRAAAQAARRRAAALRRRPQLRRDRRSRLAAPRTPRGARPTRASRSCARRWPHDT